MEHSRTDAGCEVVGVCGLDVSDKESIYWILDLNGKRMDTGSIPTTPEGVRKEFALMRRCRIVLEAGTHSFWMSRLLQEFGHEVVVAHPAKVALIAKSDTKDDRNDARLLAELGLFRVQLLFPVEHRQEDQQLDRELLKARDLLVGIRTKAICHLRGVVKTFGERLPRTDAAHFVSKALPALSADSPLKSRFQPLVEALQAVDAAIKRYDSLIDQAVEERYPETAALTQVPQVGNLTALAFILAIGDPFRYKNCRQVGAKLGLVPKRRDSGDRKPQLGITKAGDGFARRLMIQTAQRLLQARAPDTDLRRWGWKRAGIHVQEHNGKPRPVGGNKNAKKIALAAVARKLSVVLARLWKTGEVYIPVHQIGAPSSAPQRLSEASTASSHASL